MTGENNLCKTYCDTPVNPITEMTPVKVAYMYVIPWKHRL